MAQSEYNKIILLNGPRINDSEAIKKFYGRFHDDVTTIGDGIAELTYQELIQVLENIDRTNLGKTLVVLNFHGIIHEEKVAVELGSSPEGAVVAYVQDLLSTIYSILKTNFDLISYTCHGGAIVKEVDQLPYIGKIFTSSSAGKESFSTNSQAVNNEYAREHPDFNLLNYAKLFFNAQLINKFPVYYDSQTGYLFESEQATGYIASASFYSYLLNNYVPHICHDYLCYIKVLADISNFNNISNVNDVAQCSLDVHKIFELGVMEDIYNYAGMKDKARLCEQKSFSVVSKYCVNFQDILPDEDDVPTLTNSREIAEYFIKDNNIQDDITLPGFLITGIEGGFFKCDKITGFELEPTIPYVALSFVYGLMQHETIT